MSDARKRIRILTSCTGVKARTGATRLTERELGVDGALDAASARVGEQHLIAAQFLYKGQQHIRLMRGIRALRASRAPVDIELWIVSAGYGLVPAHALLAPYECTFAEMTRSQARERSRALQIPERVRELLDREADLALILLGDDYIAACELDSDVHLGAPTLAFCGRSTSIRLPPIDSLHVVELGVPEARRFSCGLVGLKGEVARRLLQAIAQNSALLDTATQRGLLDDLLAIPSQQRQRLVQTLI